MALSQSVSARILYGTGRLRWFSRALIVEAIVNLLLSVALAQPLGIEGVALGTALPNVLVNIAVMGYVCRSLGVGITKYLRRAFVGPLLVGALLAVFWLAITWRDAPRTWIALGTTGTLGLTAYAVLAIITELRLKRIVTRLYAHMRKLTSHLPPQTAQVGSRLLHEEAE